MNKRLTPNQTNALQRLAAAPGGRLPGKDGWCNGNTLTSLASHALVAYDRSNGQTVLTDLGRDAIRTGTFCADRGACRVNEHSPTGMVYTAAQNLTVDGASAVLATLLLVIADGWKAVS